ncbi:DNRLRE domain-containing protein [Nonomuraea sp. NPDC048881]|uniref:DNRLRE domain-containing protein n=1 Tax=Nonomuraea sp. NPDC048881 TaxID=3155030 RepID=UPI0033C08A89
MPTSETETMQVWANPDGKTLHAELSTTPVQLAVADAGGKRAWRPIDTTIAAKSDGTLAATLVKTPLTFGGEGAKTLVTATGADGPVSIGVGRKLPKPTVNGNTITYPDAVAKGADLVLTALADGFAQDVVFRTRPTGPVKVSLPVTLPKGKVYGKAADGHPRLMSAQGQAETPPLIAQAVDALAAQAPEQGKTGQVDTAFTTDTSGRSTIELTPDAAFLADTAVTYPVTVSITGTWIGAGDSSDTFVSSVQYPNSATLSSWLRAGRSADGELWRTYLRYVINGTDLDYAIIRNADLRLWNYHANACGTSVGVGIVARRLTSPYDYSTLTWANQPSSTSTDAVVAPGGYSATLAGCSGSGEIYHSIEGIVQAWANGTADHGLMIRAATEGVAAANWRQYRSDQYTGGDGRGPVLFIDYEPAPKRRVAFSSDYDFSTWPSYDQAVAMAQPEANAADQSTVSLNEAAVLDAAVNGGYEVKPEQLQPAPGTTWSSPDPDVQDTTEPTVVTVTPSAGAREVPTGTSVSVTFDQEVWDAAFTFKDDTGALVDGTAVMDAANTTLTFTPGAALRPGITYTAEVREAADVWDNVVTPYTWSFTTTAAASVEAAHWPLDEGAGRTAADVGGLDHDATLSEGARWVPGRIGQALSNLPEDQQAAIALHEARQRGAPVELSAKTTESSITHAMPDGTVKTEITTGPIRTRSGDGWVPIDTSLTERAGVLRPKAIAGGASLEISTGGAGPFVRMTSGNKNYGLRWPTALPKPTVKGNVVTWSDAAGKGADLVVTVLPAGFRHDVVVRERPARPLEIRIGVESSGLTLSADSSGRLLLKDRDKKTVASGARPIMWDASDKGRAQRARRAPIDTRVITAKGKTELVLKPDHAFLSDPATVLPIRVDPTVALLFQDDVETGSDFPSDPADPDLDYMMAGRMVGSIYRPHLRFDTTGLAGKTVTNAKLSLLNVDAPACGSAVGAGIQVRRLTGAWDANNLTWTGKPASTTEDAQINRAATNSDCATFPGVMEWNVTGIAQDWAAGAANHGLVLMHPTESSPADNYRVFATSENTEYADPTPKLTVTTSAPASTPAVGTLQISPAQTVNGSVVTGSLTPQLAAVVTDTVGGNLTGEFEVEHDPAATGQGSGQIWAGASTPVTSGGSSAVTLPSGKLADGWRIRWRARAVNAAATTASAWSAWQSALVDVPNPTVSGFDVSPSTSTGGVVSTGSLTPSLRAIVTHPAAQPVRAEVEVEHDPAATGQGSGQIWSGGVDGVPSGTRASVTVPGGKLSDGWKVRWRIRAVDAASVSSPWSDWQSLTVDPPDPASDPSVTDLQVNPSTQVGGETVTGVLTPSLLATVADPAAGTLRAEFEVEHDPAAPAGQGSGQIWAGGVDGIAAGTQATVTLPADRLQYGWHLRWRARAVSASAASAWADWRLLRVSQPTPTVAGPTVSPSTVVAGKTVVTSVTPTMRASVTDPAGQPLRAEIELEHDPAAPAGQGSGQIWAGGVDGVASGSQASIEVPAGKLTDGWLFRWRVRAVGTGASSAWSDWQQATVDLTAPGEEPLARTSGPVIRTDQSFTVSTWLRWQDKEGTYTAVEQRGTQQPAFRLGNSADRGLQFTLTSGDTADASSAGVYSDVEPPVGEWFHLAGVYDAASSSVSLYRNGTLLKSETVASPAWRAEGALTLGSAMVGAVDEVRLYQRALTGSEITALASPPSAAVEDDAPAATTTTAAAAALPPFDYDRVKTLADCARARTTSGSPYATPGWADVRPYSGCWSKFLAYGDWTFHPLEPDKYPPTPDDGYKVEATVVMHSYLGTADGSAVVGGGDRKPDEIKIWTQLSNIKGYDDGEETDDYDESKSLQLDVQPTGSDGTDCELVEGASRRETIKKWKANGYNEWLVKSKVAEGGSHNCTIRPLLFEFGGIPWFNEARPLWAKMEYQNVLGDIKLPYGIQAIGLPTHPGREYAPTVRCDDITFSKGFTDRQHRGACIFPFAKRIFTMKRSDTGIDEVVDHLDTAMKTPGDTIPKLPPIGENGPQQKIMPGFVDAPRVYNDQGNAYTNPAILPLVRHTDPKDTPKRDTLTYKNRKAIGPACRARRAEMKTAGTWPANVIVNGKSVPALQCDEYPFASTKNGAYNSKGHFSVRYVNRDKNHLHGQYLAAFYSRYRVGNENQFWVRIAN